jgi:hypothetical protein
MDNSFRARKILKKEAIMRKKQRDKIRIDSIDFDITTLVLHPKEWIRIEAGWWELRDGRDVFIPDDIIF